LPDEWPGKRNHHFEGENEVINPFTSLVSGSLTTADCFLEKMIKGNIDPVECPHPSGCHQRSVLPEKQMRGSYIVHIFSGAVFSCTDSRNIPC
jgi:hypothetical protein